MARLMLRRLVVLGAALAAFAGTSAPADAARPVLPYSVASTHFVVHFDSDAAFAGSVTATEAGDTAALAERAYALETGWGYPAPPDDGDGKIDIYILSLAGAEGQAVPDSSGVFSSPGSIALDEATGRDLHVISHELFHLIQFGTWIPADSWILEASAEWAGFKAEGFPLEASTSVGPYDMSLDCLDNDPSWPASIFCSRDTYEDGGYSRWSFFEFLAERYGATIVQDVLADGRAQAVAWNTGHPTEFNGGSAIQAISNVVSRKGSTLADLFTDWTVSTMTGGYTAAALQTPLVSQLAYGPPIATGTGLPSPTGVAPAPLPTQTVPVHHLSVRYLAFDRGDVTSRGPCYAATLTLTVTLPAGIASRPYFYWSEKGSTPVPLAINGTTATATVPWDTCSWSNTHGYLALPNPSTTSNVQQFVVTPTMKVDTTTLASPVAPPPQVSMPGTVVAAPTDEPAPTLDVTGPELLRVAAGTQTIRLIVQSSGSGKLHASLGPVDLGSVDVRSGGNDLRFTLPASVLGGLRTKAANGDILTLTSMSPGGSAGQVVTRHVMVEKPVAKPKKKSRRHK